jgi:hypothetical protein
MVIGVGAIGKQVATLLVSMGAPYVCVVDPDEVGVENLNVQGYYQEQIGKPKVEAFDSVAKSHNPEVKTFLHHRRYGPDIDPRNGLTLPHLVVFSCVDSIEVRSFIWQSLFESKYTKDFDLFVDGRMAAETLRMFAWKKGTDKKKYEETLFPGAEAFPVSCTGRTTLYTSYVIAGMMVGSFVKWLRKQPVPFEQAFNMLADEHAVVD